MQFFFKKRIRKKSTHSSLCSCRIKSKLSKFAIQKSFFDKMSHEKPPYTSSLYPMDLYKSQNAETPSAPTPLAPQISVATTVKSAVQLGPFCTLVNCPRCKQDVYTVVKSNANCAAWAWGVLLCCIGCACGCCCIPCFMDRFRHIHHYCPNCKCKIGTYKH